MSPEAEEAFAEYLALLDEGEVDFDAFCADRPQLADELRRMRALWTKLSPLIDGPGSELPEDARYAVEGELGRGGMGVVFRVFDANLRRRLAMKVIRSDAATGGAPPARRLARFLEEARVTGNLVHPGIVPIHELRTDEDGGAFYTMPLVEGHTFEEVIELARAGRGGWSLTRALSVLLRAVEAVAYAHSRGVVHRDLKPANVMVGRFGETYVLDWGLAKATGAENDGSSADGPGLTLDGDVVGTPAYMAPEQAAGRTVEVGAAADVYACGAILYHLLAGERPYDDGSQRSSLEVLELVRSGPPRALPIRPGTPAELVAICARAMARDPDARYASMEALNADLRSYLEGRVVSAYESGGWAELKKWVQRNRGFAAAIAGVVLAIGAGVAVWIRQERLRAEEEFLSLDVYRCAAYLAEAEGLYPALPQRVEAMTAWLGPARDLARRRPAHAERGPNLLDDLDALDRAIESVEERIEWAERVERLTVVEPADAWSAARERVTADARFEGLALEPQVGLIPLGPDPASGLEEFAHLRSGRAPERVDGRALAPDAASSIVFVLLPGEGQPFFLSKFELTVAQWERTQGAAAAGAALEPVTWVSWNRAAQGLARLDLALPSERQWEHGARAGTAGRWWGEDAGLDVLEQEHLRGGTPATVGSRSPNPFGLYDTMGNALEWCADVFEDDERRVFRGASFGLQLDLLNVGMRMRDHADFTMSALGLRPARPVR
ncbi:MAG: bifunctional serine/threonine-protein kinase/formylglycine-generating enzyme family protein [Planctomycetota bacterium]